MTNQAAARNSRIRPEQDRPRVGTIPKPAAIDHPETDAPASPPRLKKAWNDDMMGRPQHRSTRVAFVFIDTSMDPLQAPATKEAPTRTARDGARPGTKSA